MSQPIRVLLVEDSETDAMLLLRQLRKGGYDPQSKRVDTAKAMAAALEEQSWDLVISDYVLPGFGGLQALEILKAKNLDLPFIIASGQIGEDIAVQSMKAGAHDYLMKDNLARLAPAVERELREAETRRERREADQRLKDTAEQLLRSNQELTKAQEQLRARNDELMQARDELEMRVIKRTAALSKANTELHHQMEERKRLEQELLDITEQERRRIGIDLHDDLGQQLTGLAFMVKGLQQKLAAESPQRSAEAEKIHALISKTIQCAHDLAQDLASEFDGENLGAALSQLAHRVRDVFSVECKFESNGRIPAALPPAVAAHLYKIAQEALTNGIKHGKGQHLSVRMVQQHQNLVLSVWNDGLPFPAEASSKSRMGLRIMNYRAHVIGASLAMSSDEKSGTLVTCSVPVRLLQAAPAEERELAVVG